MAYPCLHTEGGLIPADIIDAIAAGEKPPACQGLGGFFLAFKTARLHKVQNYCHVSSHADSAGFTLTSVQGEAVASVSTIHNQALC